MQLETQFTDRAALAQYLQAQFPTAAERGAELSTLRGGRRAGEETLGRVKPGRYAATRNMLSGAVTRLSPYLRHGVLTLAEVRRFVLRRASRTRTVKLLQELTWRDYYQHVYARLGDEIWHDIEPYKTGLAADAYAEHLPEEIKQGTTGLNCIDSFARDLRREGYLHNHARMWTAAYVVHHRRVRWQAGASWFLQHLLDGDPASNNLSWQWVASTFAARPYYFNRENLARFSNNQYCPTCPLLHDGCPFEGDNEEIATRLFPNNSTSTQQAPPPHTTLAEQLSAQPERHDANYNGAQATIQIVRYGRSPEDQHNIPPAPHLELVWVHEDSLNPYGPALDAHAQATPIFVFDEAAIEQAGWTLKRLAFIYECLLEIPNIQIFKGDPGDILSTQLTAHSQHSGLASTLATTIPVDPRLQRIIKHLPASSLIRLYEIEPFVAEGAGHDLRRFARYWHEVESAVVAPEK